MRKTAVLVTCYKRPEYTELCLKALYSAQSNSDVTFYLVDEGGNKEVIEKYARPEKDIISIHLQPIGLRNSIIEFFNWSREVGFKYLAKMDNDCTVPNNWLFNLIDVIEKTDRDIVSPNVYPSNAAYVLGKEGDQYRPSEYVGGLWCMKASLIDGIDFEKYEPNGIVGAFNIIKQIIAENEAKCGWVHTVTVEDIGHWSGTHPLHIKTKEHEEYSVNVGRSISWTAA